MKAYSGGFMSVDSIIDELQGMSIDDRRAFFARAVDEFGPDSFPLRAESVDVAFENIVSLPEQQQWALITRIEQSEAVGPDGAPMQAVEWLRAAITAYSDPPPNVQESPEQAVLWLRIQAQAVTQGFVAMQRIGRLLPPEYQDELDVATAGMLRALRADLPSDGLKTHYTPADVNDTYRLRLNFGSAIGASIWFNRGVLAEFFSSYCRARAYARMIDPKGQPEIIWQANRENYSCIETDAVAATLAIVPPEMTLEAFRQLSPDEQMKYSARGIGAAADKANQDNPEWIATTHALDDHVLDMVLHVEQVLGSEFTTLLDLILSAAEAQAMTGGWVPRAFYDAVSWFPRLGLSVIEEAKRQWRDRITTRDQRFEFFTEYKSAHVVLAKVNRECFKTRGRAGGKRGELTEEAWIECRDAKIPDELTVQLAKGKPSDVALLYAGQRVFGNSSREDDINFFKWLLGECNAEFNSDKLGGLWRVRPPI
jgi:hypothetical protein